MDVISWWCQLRTRQGLDGGEQLPDDWERTDSLKESRRVRRGWREWRSSVPVQVIKEQGSCSNHSGIRLLETMKTLGWLSVIFALRVLIEMYTGGQKELHLGGILENFFEISATYWCLSSSSTWNVAWTDNIFCERGGIAPPVGQQTSPQPVQNGELMILFIWLIGCISTSSFWSLKV